MINRRTLFCLALAGLAWGCQSSSSDTGSAPEGDRAYLLPVLSEGPAAGRVRAVLREPKPGRYRLAVYCEMAPGAVVDVYLLVGDERTQVVERSWLAVSRVREVDVRLPGPVAMTIERGGLQTSVQVGDKRVPVRAEIRTARRDAETPASRPAE